jgi:hypothetical protein
VNGGVVLELHVPDFDLVRECYKQLGFETVWEREPEEKKGYLVLEGPGPNRNVLCFWAGNEHAYQHSYFQQFGPDTRPGYAVEIVLMVDDVRTYFARVQEVEKRVDKLEIVSELAPQPWGLHDFRVADPHGFYLRFTEPYDVRSDAHAVP